MKTEPGIEPIGRFSRQEVDEIVNHCKRAYQAELIEIYGRMAEVEPNAKDRYYSFVGRLKSYLETNTTSPTQT